MDNYCFLGAAGEMKGKLKGKVNHNTKPQQQPKKTKLTFQIQLENLILPLSKSPQIWKLHHKPPHRCTNIISGVANPYELISHLTRQQLYYNLSASFWTRAVADPRDINISVLYSAMSPFRNYYMQHVTGSYSSFTSYFLEENTDNI